MTNEITPDDFPEVRWHGHWVRSLETSGRWCASPPTPAARRSDRSLHVFGSVPCGVAFGRGRGAVWATTTVSVAARRPCA